MVLIIASTCSVGVNGSCLYVTFSVLVPFGRFSHVMLINAINRLTDSVVCEVGAQIWFVVTVRYEILLFGCSDKS